MQALGRANARVIDQNIDGAKLRFSVCNGRTYGGLVGHIELYGMRIASLAFNLSAQCLQLVHAAAGQYDGRTSPRQSTCKLSTQSAAGTGYKGNTSGKVNLISHGQLSFFR